MRYLSYLRRNWRCRHARFEPLCRKPEDVFDDDASTMTLLNLSSLEARVDELISALGDLSDENRALRDQQSNLLAERAALIEKSELARSRVESMIARLKAMEVSS
ncbi:MAG: cell division protein ZapB [Gammaproteobacteria bacterium]